MLDGITSQPSLEYSAMWRHMQVLVDRLFRAIDADSDTRLDDCLDVLVEFLGADRALLFLTFPDGTVRAVNARGNRKALTAEEREEISRTILGQALETDRTAVVDALAKRNASSSMKALGIRYAVAVPLHIAEAAKEGRRGAVYFDFRDPQRHVTERHVEFSVSASLLLGTVLEHGSRAETIREHLREANAHRVESTVTPSISELLAPPSMSSIRREVESALGGTSPILLLGESGTGKTLLAQAIAEASGRRPIVRAVLGSSDDLNTITSELFGHQRGSFSGAIGSRVGLVEYANSGTLILDEILNLPAHAQKLLLDFTQFGKYRPLGYEKPTAKQANVRIIGATNGDLRSAVRDGRFRLDLYHRLAGVVIELPPLRARREDIVPLAESTLSRLDHSRSWTLSLALRRSLLAPSLRWSGNVRQLERVVARMRERALVRDPEATVLTPEHVESTDIDGVSLSDACMDQPSPEKDDLGAGWQRLQAERERIDEAEHDIIRRALRKANGTVAQAARELGIARTTLSSRMDALSLRGPRGSAPPTRPVKG